MGVPAKASKSFFTRDNNEESVETIAGVDVSGGHPLLPTLAYIFNKES